LQKPTALFTPISSTPSTLSEKSTPKLAKEWAHLSREKVKKFILKERYFTYYKLKYINYNYPKKQTCIQEVTNIYLTKYSKHRIKKVTEEAVTILNRTLKN